MALPPEVANHESSDRLSRNDWLERSLELLADGELLPLRIGELSAKLGVTKGSFYWHFEDRAEFVRHFVEHWMEAMSVASTRVADTSAESPCSRLKAVMLAVWSENHDKYDLAMRAWALTEPVVAEAVRDVDIYRYDYTRSLFQEMGFEDAEIEHRSLLFYSFMAGMRIIRAPGMEERSPELAEAICRLVCASESAGSSDPA